MDDGTGSSLSLILLLIACYAFFNLAYSAITNARPTQTREQAESGRRGAQRVRHIVDNLVRFNIVYHLSLLLLGLAMGAIAAQNIAQPLMAARPDLAPVAVYALVFGLLFVAVVLVGHTLPSALGSSFADLLAPLLAGPTRFVMLLLSPVVVVMIGSGKLMSNLFGGNTLAVTVTEEEIMTLLDAGQKEGTIDDEEKAMIFSVLQFGETLVREVMVPRIDIEASEINTPLDVALRQFVESGHSRIPVYDEHIDNIEGLLYAKDLLAVLNNGGPESVSIRDLMRPAYFLPETKRADLALKEMQKSTIHMAIVVDEYGGTAGIVTIENLIEEIVGDIQDEYDVEEEAEYLQHNDHEWTIDASMDLHDVSTLLDVSLPADEYDTLGGFIYAILGRVPVPGEMIEQPEFHLSMAVKTVEGRRIRKVHVTRHITQEEKAADDDLPTVNDHARAG